MDHIDIAGIGVNLTCYGAIVPDEDNLGRLADLALQSEKLLGRPELVGFKRTPRSLAIQGDACIKSAAGLPDVKSGSVGGFPLGWFLFHSALLLRGSKWYKSGII